MPEVNEVVYAKHREHGRHHCAYILLGINHDMEFLVVWFKHPTWGEQGDPTSLDSGDWSCYSTGGIGNINKNNREQRKGRNKNNPAMMY
eukprot:12058751-Ditylum_brightwellii.AAC.1